MRIRSLVLGCCLSLMTAGCASIHTRLEPMAPDFVAFPGLTALFAGPDESALGTESRKKETPAAPGTSTAWIALCVLDIPFSLVLDTALLPFDLLTWPMRAPNQTSPDASARERTR